MSIKILYLTKNFIPPQNRFLATPLADAFMFESRGAKVKVAGRSDMKKNFATL